MASQAADSHQCDDDDFDGVGGRQVFNDKPRQVCSEIVPALSPTGPPVGSAPCCPGFVEATYRRGGRHPMGARRERRR
ncbi:hypothetical protein N9L68_06825 [bacterium]|nr:hypothetical protein [bacterium]